MTTRRNLIKVASTLGVASALSQLPARAASLPTVAMDDTRFIGTPLEEGSLFRAHSGYDRGLVARHIGMDQDIDGSWSVWCDRVGPGDEDDRPPEGGIRVYDPAVAHFLEQLHTLLLNPVAFGHQTIGRREAA